MNSIRHFLISSILAVIVLVFFASSIRGYQNSMQASDLLFDAKMEEMAHILAGISEQLLSNSGNTYPINDLHHDAINPQTHSALDFQIWDHTPKLLVSSVDPNQFLRSDLKPGFGHSNYSGTRWRTYTHFFPEHQRWVWLAEQQDSRFTLAENLVLESFTPSLLAMPIITLIIFGVIFLGTRPISELAERINQQKANDLREINLSQVPQELKPLTQSVNRLLQRLERSLKHEKHLAANAAHELRTPITTLKLQVENLLALDSDNPQIQLLSQTADRLKHMTEQILAFNKMTAESFSAQVKPLNPLPILRQVVAEQFEALRLKSQTIELIADDQLASQYPIHSSPLAIETLLANLLSNASKYTPEDGHIRINLEVTEFQVILSVHDNGPGITPKLRERALEPFYRLHGDRHTSLQPGSGLGLAIVHHIVDLHQAKLQLADSELPPSAGQPGLAVIITFNRNPFEV